MPLLTKRRALWLAINLTAAVFLPIAFAWWLQRQVKGSDATLPDGFDPEAVVLIFTVSWAVFLLLLNVTMAVFLWLRRR